MASNRLKGSKMEREVAHRAPGFKEIIFTENGVLVAVEKWVERKRGWVMIERFEVS